MDVVGLHPVERNRVIKIIQSIAAEDLANLYSSLRDADERLQAAMILFLQKNPYPGYEKALRYLEEVQTPSNACRAAAVCLLLNRSE